MKLFYSLLLALFTAWTISAARHQPKDKKPKKDPKPRYCTLFKYSDATCDTKVGSEYWGPTDGKCFEVATDLYIKYTVTKANKFTGSYYGVDTCDDTAAALPVSKVGGCTKLADADVWVRAQCDPKPPKVPKDKTPKDGGEGEGEDEQESED